MPVSRKRKKTKPAGTGASRAAGPPALPDRRAMEGVLAMLTPSGSSDSTSGALHEAQDLMYSAWETNDRRRRIVLANEALRLSPLCADAFVLLAEETAETPAEAIELYRQGVEAGQRALGPAPFKEAVGHFWGLLETRPYMRARSGLAQALWATGRHVEAIGHYREMLRLNPNDNQGIRYLLAECLLKLDRDEEVGALIDEYGEGSAEFGYTAGLLAFRSQGDTAKARSLLRGAVTMNRHVPTYLLGRKKLPRKLPAYITVGGEDEAQEYARRYGLCWAGTAAAVEWLAANTGRNKPRHRS
ncbi:MAG TPA: tetratricopeptide repeat protein [Stellaceae bacterium]|nr:tetratricopeptide repeat protein [Stellaceae bacterium]